MTASLRGKMDVSVASDERPPEKVSTVESNYQLWPSCEIVRLKRYLKGEIPGDFLPIRSSDLTDKRLFACDSDPISAMHDYAEGSEGIILRQEALLKDTIKSYIKCVLLEHFGDEGGFLFLRLFFELLLHDFFLLGFRPDLYFFLGEFAFHINYKIDLNVSQL